MQVSCHPANIQLFESIVSCWLDWKAFESGIKATGDVHQRNEAKKATSDSITVYLISGANRGLGLGLVKETLKNNPHAVVFAGARDPSKASDLQTLAAHHPDRLFVVRLVSADKESNEAVVEEIGRRYGRVDVVIANAAISNSLTSVADVPIEIFREHYEVNVIGPLMLFQTTQSLLKASKNPKFIPITSIGGSSTTASNKIKIVCYASTKAALNRVARSIHNENEWLVCFPFCPGPVETDMMAGSVNMDDTGFFDSLVARGLLSPEQSGRIVIQKIESATRQEDGGKFYHVDGNLQEVVEIPW